MGLDRAYTYFHDFQVKAIFTTMIAVRFKTGSYFCSGRSRRDCKAKAKGRRAKLARPSHALRRDTIYVNPYYIVTHYSNYAEVTKHYYNGTARLAAQLEGDYDYLDKVQLLEGAFNPVEEDGKALLNDLNLVEGTDYSSAALYEVEATYPLVVMSQAEFNSAVTGLWGELPPASTMPCHISMYWPFANNGVNCNGAGVMYFYHPDYLGNTEYITDYAGEAYQYFHYSPFGEALIENKSNLGTHTDYFRFNGKELDPETGNYYYGARYYDPKVSIWLSVDPLAHKYPNLSPYVFVANNPVLLVDPDGRKIEFSDGTLFFNKVKFMLKQWNLNRKSRTAKAQWKGLNSSDHTHTIHVNENSPSGKKENMTIPKGSIDSENGNGNGTDIYIDLSSTSEDGAPIEIGIGHEEAHASRFDQGKVEGELKLTVGGSVTVADKLKVQNRRRITEEREASHIENIIRSEFDPKQKKFGLRSQYKNIPQYVIDPISGRVQGIKQVDINVIKPGYEYYKGH